LKFFGISRPMEPDILAHDWMRTLNHARAEISPRSGSYLDPAVVEVLLKIPNEVWVADVS
jgi:hypothetical protein